MTGLVDRLLGISGPVLYALVALLVFAEDALFVGFVIPGETAAVLGGVIASRGHATVWGMISIVVAAAITGDSVGYEVGRHVGTRILAHRWLDKRRRHLDTAQDFLRRRGAAAIFLGRFTAFFRAVMPALAGTARLPYPKFLAFNAAGGLIWGTGFVLLGYLAGDSYQRIEKAAGRGAAYAVAGILVLALITWRVHVRRRRAHSP